MVEDPPPAQRPPPQKLPRAGQIPKTAIDIQPTRHLSKDVQPTRQLPEPTISPPDYRLPDQSERQGVSRIIIAVISMVAVLGGLAIIYWWLHR